MTRAVHGNIRFILDSVKERYPNVPAISLPVIDLGNNDFEKDYQLKITSTDPCLIDKDGNLPQSTNQWLQNMVEDFSEFFMNEEEAASFACGGYLVREMSENLNVIVLNTVLWSTELDQHNQPKPEIDEQGFDFTDPQFDPFGMHTWLEVTLSSLRSQNKKVYITGHIPPVVMSFVEAIGENLMYEHHVDRFYSTVSQYNDVVSGIFFGHLHSNEIRRIPNNGNKNTPPLIISGSMSPVYDSNPFFHVVTYDRDGSKFPLDLTSYSTDLENVIRQPPPNDSFIQFQPIFSSFLDFFEMEVFTNAEVEKLAAKFIQEDINMDESPADPQRKVWGPYWNQWYKGTPQIKCHDTCRVQEACTMTCGMTTESWKTCISNRPTIANPDHNAPNMMNMCTLPSNVYTESNTVLMSAVVNDDNVEVNPNSKVILYASVAALVSIIFLSFMCWACVSIAQFCQRKKRDLIPLDDINIDVNIDLDSTFSGNERSLDLRLPTIT